MRGAVSLLAVGLAVGCGGYSKPTDHLVASQASVRSAEEIGAQTSPRAQLHVRLAREELEQAQRMMDKGDNEHADYLLMRAKADADLAIALARTGHMMNEPNVEETR